MDHVLKELFNFLKFCGLVASPPSTAVASHRKREDYEAAEQSWEKQEWIQGSQYHQ